MPLDIQGWMSLTPSERDQQRHVAVGRAREVAKSHNVYISVEESVEQAQAEGELAGIPFAVKDNIDVAGRETTGGSPLLTGHVAEVDADLVSLLREAGAVVIGKANLHELAFGATSNNATYGAVRNPFDDSRVAGGSSGGSAAAVALGSVPFSLGSDTGGSVTVPSAFCGIAGFRPTTGRYPGTGVVNLSTSRDTIGIHARTVADIITVDNVVTRTSPATPPALEGLVLGRVASRFEGVEGAVFESVEAAMENLIGLGVTIVDVEVADDLEMAGGPGIELVFYETERLVPARLARGLEKHANFGSLVDRFASPDVKNIASGIAEAHVSAESYELARRVRWELRRRYAQMFSQSKVDALIAPTVAVLPPHIGHDETIDVDGVKLPTFPTLIRNAGPGTVAGMPMLTVPGLMTNGLPVGLCLEGRPFDDTFVLAIGELIESAIG